MGGVDAPCLEAVGIVVVNVVAGRLVSAVHSQAEAVTVPSVLPGSVERGIMVGCGVDVEVLHVVIARIGGILRFRIGIAVPTAQHDVFRGAVVEGEVYAIDAGFREVGVFLAFLYFEELFFGGDFYLYQLYHVADEVGISGQARLELASCILHADGSVL